MPSTNQCVPRLPNDDDDDDDDDDIIMTTTRGKYKFTFSAVQPPEKVHYFIYKIYIYKKYTMTIAEFRYIYTPDHNSYSLY